jgi:hypothetical protein
MSTPEEHLMSLHDLELKKRILNCIRERFNHDLDNKIKLIDSYIEGKKKSSQELQLSQSNIFNTCVKEWIEEYYNSGMTADNLLKKIHSKGLILLNG